MVNDTPFGPARCGRIDGGGSRPRVRERGRTAMLPRASVTVS